MAYRKTVRVTVRVETLGKPPTVFYDPRDRRQPFIWFGENAPAWVRDGDVVVIAKTGQRRPSWRIVDRAPA